MADTQQTDQFMKSWWQWRNSLGPDQRWMADAMAFSAAHTGDVHGFQSTDWSWDQMRSWFGEQNSAEWQKWSENWRADARWAQ